MKTMAYRLTIRYTSAFILFFGMASLLFYVLVNALLNNQLEQDLQEDLQEFSRFYKMGGLHQIQQEIAKEMLSEDADSVFFAVIDRDGRIQLSSDLATWANVIPDTDKIQGLMQARDPQFRQLASVQKEYPYVAASIALDNDNLMLLGESTEELSDFLDLLLKVFLGVFAVAIPAAALAGWMMAQNASKNIQQISQTASRIQRGQFESRVELHTKDAEIQTLIDAFNAMLDRIKDLMKEMRELTDNVAHDMRSPIARIRAISESQLTTSHQHCAEQNCEEQNCAEQNKPAIIIKECDRLIQMINATLDVAEAESGVVKVNQDIVDMSRLTADACELFEAVAEQQHIALIAGIEQGCQLTGNIAILQRMLANILDNAIKYTPAQGKIAVTLEKKEKRIEITVADTGIGISLADQERIFERFFRCDNSRTLVGCGLGLSYSRAVAHAHGGQIYVSSTPGIGSRFSIVLPTVIDIG